MKDLELLIHQALRGKRVTQSLLRQHLTRKYAVDIARPLTTGIFLGTVSDSVEEQQAQGRMDGVSYWRVVQNKGHLHSTFPSGVVRHTASVKTEGHKILSGTEKEPPTVPLTTETRWEFPEA